MVSVTDAVGSRRIEYKGASYVAARVRSLLMPR